MLSRDTPHGAKLLPSPPQQLPASLIQEAVNVIDADGLKLLSPWKPPLVLVYVDLFPFHASLDMSDV